MPRATHPIDAVTKYFQRAPLEEADLALAVVRGILRDRKLIERPEPAVIKVKHPRKRRTPKLTQPSLLDPLAEPVTASER